MIARWQKDIIKISVGSFILQCARGFFPTIKHETVVEKLIGMHYHMPN